MESAFHPWMVDNHQWNATYTVSDQIRIHLSGIQVEKYHSRDTWFAWNPIYEDQILSLCLGFSPAGFALWWSAGLGKRICGHPRAATRSLLLVPLGGSTRFPKTHHLQKVVSETPQRRKKLNDLPLADPTKSSIQAPPTLLEHGITSGSDSFTPHGFVLGGDISLFGLVAAQLYTFHGTVSAHPVRPKLQNEAARCGYQRFSIGWPKTSALGPLPCCSAANGRNRERRPIAETPSV